MKTEPIYRTNNRILRFVVDNIFHRISMLFFNIGLRANDRIEWDYQYKRWNKMLEWFGWNWYYIFNKPYSKWGTTYRIVGWENDYLKAWKEELLNDPVLEKLGSDYDENGVPYWEKWEHQPDTIEKDGSQNPAIKKDIDKQ